MATKEIEQRLYRPDEAAHYLGITERTLKTLRAEGRIRPVKMGGRTLRYDVQDLDTLIEAWKTGAADD